MVAAGGYILQVPKDRRELLLQEAEHGGSFYRSKPLVSEPVSPFDHSRRAPLAVFASFKDGFITHIADGRKGQFAATGLVRLNLEDLQPLKRPVSFDEILAGISARVAWHVEQRLKAGGLLPSKSLDAFVDCITELDTSISPRLARYSGHRAQALRRLEPRVRENLAYQKESLGLALEIAGISRDELLAWTPTDDQPQSFLDGLPGARVREDAMLLADFSTLPGFEAIGETTHYGSKVFVSERDPSKRLTVIMANRLPLEQQTGADLVYFNEAYRSFVLVQYKAMEKRDSETEFRWQAKDQFCDEIDRMESLLAELRKLPSGQQPDGFRFSDNPFFLKFCPRVVFNPDDKGLFKGIYLPLDLWKRADAAGWFTGKRGGKVLTFDNVGRRINNSEFVGLVAGSWVGTTIEQSAVLGELVRKVLETGKTVTIAIKHASDTADDSKRSAE
ncbi:hypothetical protein JCM17844_19990 [Iodidimonas gelatinilytica]|uniref:Uncharacterized protein n=2 Tax=Iodidimonas gelatinilytica TaxID=1236966 RepID=A0A5A7MQN7_9PROT|nr:hypothetical protein [Iodidimonas gelatinilytica]GEQ98362.1 hypothetical protein JCM17844_19990 [Iodidimonas gelatinilytica]